MMTFAYIHHSHDARQRGQLEDANWLAYSQQLQERVHQRHLDRRFKRIVGYVDELQQQHQYEWLKQQDAVVMPRSALIAPQWEPLYGPGDHRPTLPEAIKLAGTNTYRLTLAIGKGQQKHLYEIVHCERVPGPEVRQRLATIMGMHPSQIRWPVRLRKGNDDDAA